MTTTTHLKPPRGGIPAEGPHLWREIMRNCQKVQARLGGDPIFGLTQPEGLHGVEKALQKTLKMRGAIGWADMGDPFASRVFTIFTN